MADPIHQFEVVDYFPVVKIGSIGVAFTNSALYMGVAVAITIALMLGATAGRQLVPGRLQSIAELAHEFVADTIRNTIGEEGMRFFPLVFSLFMFILVSNIIGLIPYNFTVASHIIITVALALLVFFTVIIYGLWKNGLHFFNLFVPKGVPVYILPLIVFIEVLSFLSRPISHSVRLFANMLAGHITLYVFAGFVTMLGGLGILGWFGAVAAARPHRRADRARASGGLPAGLCVHHPHLHLSQRCPSPGPLTAPSPPRIRKRPEKRSFIMDPVAAKYIGAGIACIGMGGAGVGVGTIFGNYLAAALRNPSAAQGQFGNLIFGFAVTEALGIFSLLIALLLLFAL